MCRRWWASPSGHETCWPDGSASGHQAGVSSVVESRQKSGQEIFIKFGEHIVNSKALRWVDYIVEAITNLGGVATLSQIYAEVDSIRKEPFAETWHATVRRTLQENSSDTQIYNGREDPFYSVEGIGSGIWGLRDYTDPETDIITTSETETAQLAEQKRVVFIQSRIIRNTRMTQLVKRLHNYRCQICSYTIQKADQTFYCEAHHIRPLGRHSGPDLPSNILCVCPNHHAELDLGTIQIDWNALTLHPEHQINQEYVNFHNEVIYRGFQISE